MCFILEGLRLVSIQKMEGGAFIKVVLVQENSRVYHVLVNSPNPGNEGIVDEVTTLFLFPSDYAILFSEVRELCDRLAASRKCCILVGTSQDHTVQVRLPQDITLYSP